MLRLTQLGSHEKPEFDSQFILKAKSGGGGVRLSSQGLERLRQEGHNKAALCLKEKKKEKNKKKYV